MSDMREMSEDQVRSMTATETINTLYDRALQRYLAAIDFEARDHLTEEELIQWDAAWTVELGAPTQAQARRKAGTVVIEVLGGVAYVMSHPDDVEVEIIDHDDENAEAEKERNE